MLTMPLAGQCTSSGVNCAPTRAADSSCQLLRKTESTPLLPMGGILEPLLNGIMSVTGYGLWKRPPRHVDEGCASTPVRLDDFCSSFIRPCFQGDMPYGRVAVMAE